MRPMSTSVAGSPLFVTVRATSAEKPGWTTGIRAPDAWLVHHVARPLGPLFCVIDAGALRRPWAATEARAERRQLAANAGIRRRFAPHQLDRRRRRYRPSMPFRVISPEDFEWITRPHDEGEPARHVAELSDMAQFAHTRANVWRYEPGARGRRHRHFHQEETFVVLDGTLTMYLGEPPRRVEVRSGGLIHVPARTPLQTVNHGSDDLLVYVYGYPAEDEQAELLDSAV
jgi:mannose-6-phosphate isomerase-like protein (cupin superfamily)